MKDVYIANRVAEIKTLINHHHVNVMYVHTKDNPADHHLILLRNLLDKNNYFIAIQFMHILLTVNVNLEVKTTIKQLNLYLENGIIRAKGRIINSDIPLDATTPFFLPNRSLLVDLLIKHIHTSHNHIGLSQTLSLYRQRCWTPKIRSHIKSLLFRCVVCQRIKSGTIKRLPTTSPTSRTSQMGPAVYQCGRGPYGEFHHKGRKGQQDQGLHLHLRVRYHSRCPPQSRGEPKHHLIHHVPEAPRRLKGSSFNYLIRQSPHIYSG